MFVPRSTRSLGPDENIIRSSHYLLKKIRHWADTTAYLDSTDTHYYSGESTPDSLMPVPTKNSSVEDLHVYAVNNELKETAVKWTIFSYKSVIRPCSYKNNMAISAVNRSSCILLPWMLQYPLQFLSKSCNTSRVLT